MSEGAELIQVARIIKSNGTDGELVMGFRDILPEDIDIQEPVFIYCDGLPVPFLSLPLSLKAQTRHWSNLSI